MAHRRTLLAGVVGWRVTKGLEDWDLRWRFAQAGHRFSTPTERTVTIH